MEQSYYIVSEGQQAGPFPKGMLKMKGLTRDTLVWRQGMTDWQKASELPELSDLFVEEIKETASQGQGYEAAVWYAMLNGRQVGPSTPSELIAMGMQRDTPVWREGMQGWSNAASQVELMQSIFEYERGAQQPPYNPYSNAFSNPQPPYGQNPNPNNIQPAQPYTNWLPWAIVTTVLGGFCGCIGLILGIIAIVQANKANNFYRIGDTQQGDSANSAAKTLTIVGLIVDGLSLIFGLVFLNSYTSMLSNFSPVL